jgi:hypothetical protein
VNVIPVLKPVTVSVLERPQFNNARIASYRQWMDDNANTLARYWHACGRVLGMSETDDADFDMWLHVQYDIEATREARAKP